MIARVINKSAHNSFLAKYSNGLCEEERCDIIGVDRLGRGRVILKDEFAQSPCGDSARKNGITNAVPDILVIKSGAGGTTKRIIAEVKAGDNVITSNFNSQCLRYFQEIADVEDLRLFRRSDVTLTKQQVIESWKNGVTNNQKVRELFTDYYNRINDADIDVTFTQAQLENFLSTNDNWFNLIFNSSF